MKHFRFILPLLLIFLAHILLAQQKNLPLNREWGLNIENVFNTDIPNIDEKDCRPHVNTKYLIFMHSNFKPYIEQSRRNLDFYTYYNYVKGRKTANLDSAITASKWLKRKIKLESLIIIKDTSDKFHLTLDPLFNFEYGKDQADSSKSFYKNTRGALIRGDIGSKFSFESSFYENQATFVDYIKDFNDTYLVVPGQGRWKKFKTNGYDFAMASGYISYSPSRHFNFQVGHSKHFIGDGYRSLLLSDNAFNYPFARITSTFGKFQYTNLYASFMNMTAGGVTTPPGTERLFQKKAANFQFLSWNVHKRVQLGFFQGLIWQASDSMNRQCLKLAYASPVIYTAALTEGLRGNNNVLLGTTIKLKLSNSFSFYGQYMLDDFGLEQNSHFKNGIQFGIKYFDVAGVRNLHFQAELNGASSYAYSSTKPYQSYSHYNQALAHPLGSNFSEVIAIANYRIGDFFTQLKFNYATTGMDGPLTNNGNNIFASDTMNIPFGPSWGERTLKILDFHIGYLINPSTNFNIVAGISNRSSTSPIENSQSNFIYFGIRTSLNNVYYDF